MERNCWCNRNSVMKTAWRSSSNAGRRFLGCPDWSEDRHGSCNFFVWVDLPMCERSRVVIPGLIRRLENIDGEIQGLKDELKHWKSRARFAWVVLIVTWMLILYFMFISSEDEKFDQ